MRRIKTYIIKRILLLIPVFFGVTFITFALMYLSPGDPAEMMLQAQGIPVDAHLVEEVRHSLGIDRPFLEQYGSWLVQFLQGDLGISYAENRPVSEMIRQAIPTTFRLTAYAFLFTVLFSVPLGILSAVKQNKLTDGVIRIFSFIGIAIPNFFLALILVYIVSIRLHWLPILGDDTTVRGMLLPAFSLATAMTCKYIRQIRAAVLEELKQGYVRGARVRGVPERVILFRNVLGNAMLTLITMFAMTIGNLLGGTAVVERIFSMQGLGNMAMSAISTRDYPVVQGFVAWMAIIFVVVNLVADLLYLAIDPRQRARMGYRTKTRAGGQAL